VLDDDELPPQPVSTTKAHHHGTSPTRLRMLSPKPLH
jgi:hypothetical protein